MDIVPRWLPASWGLPDAGRDVVQAIASAHRLDVGESRVLGWSVSGGLGGEPWTAPDILEVSRLAAILRTFSDLADVRFSYAGFFDTPQAAAAAGSVINFSLTDSGSVFGSAVVWAAAFEPQTLQGAMYAGQESDVFINAAGPALALPSYGSGSVGWHVVLHEVAHALGLKHPHEGGDGRGLTLREMSLASLDSQIFTAMSYQPHPSATLRSQFPATPMVLDMLALQHLYGPNPAAHAGDSTHSLRDDGLLRTLWDADGNDLISAHGAVEGWFIQLPNWHPSTLVHSAVGYAAPLAQVAGGYTPSGLQWLTGTLEAAQGSSHADVLVGTAAADRFTGGGGDDTIDGGGGIDLATLSGARIATRLRVQGGSTIAEGPDGRDVLVQVERLGFDDGALALDIDGHAGDVARLAAAVFGVPSLQDERLIGIGLSLRDAGWDLPQLADLALAHRLGPLRSVEATRLLVETNIPDFVTSEAFVSDTDLVLKACSAPSLSAALDLVGLAARGLPYILLD